MFKVELSKNCVSLQASGTGMEITADVCKVIQLTYDKLKGNGEQFGQMFLDGVKSFVNDWDFDETEEGNVKKAREEAVKQCEEAAKQINLPKEAIKKLLEILRDDEDDEDDGEEEEEDEKPACEKQVKKSKKK